jgi:hypothetical protein
LVKRADSQYCSDTCQNSAWRRRKRQWQRDLRSLGARPTLKRLAEYERLVDDEVAVMRFGDPEDQATPNLASKMAEDGVTLDDLKEHTTSARALARWWDDYQEWRGIEIQPPDNSRGNSDLYAEMLLATVPRD